MCCSETTKRCRAAAIETLVNNSCVAMFFTPSGNHKSHQFALIADIHGGQICFLILTAYSHPSIVRSVTQVTHADHAFVARANSSGFSK
jgi:hypothetical protein